MRLLLSRWLFILVIIQVTHPAWIWIDYQIRFDYYSNVLCVNKNKPELHCHGKCALNKALLATAKDPALPSGLITEWFNYFLGLPAKPDWTVIKYTPTPLWQPTHTTNMWPSRLYTASIFKPPTDAF